MSMNIRIKGRTKLSGEITPSGSKNSAVAMIPASLMFSGTTTLHNVPDITDVERLVKIMAKLGSKIDWNKDTSVITIDNSQVTLANMAKGDLGSMRGTSLLWGPMLARFGKLVFDDLPGGCSLGARSLSPHYQAFSDLGVEVIQTNNSLTMDAQNAKASEIWLTEMSPTVTENVLMLASTLPGHTKIVGACSDPQVQDLCEFLTTAGVKITGIGSSILEVDGIKLPENHQHTIWPDHYEIATFLALGAATDGNITVHHNLQKQLMPIWRTFEDFGIKLHHTETSTTINGPVIKAPKIVRAQPWPALLVDLLPIFIPLALKAEHSHVLFHNWMYEAGLFWTSELSKFGAEVVMCDPHRIIVMGGNKLKGDKIEAPYIIRAVVSLAMCAMMAGGESIILNADSLYRGHPRFAENLKKLGAQIEEI